MRTFISWKIVKFERKPQKRFLMKQRMIAKEIILLYQKKISSLVSKIHEKYSNLF